MYYVSQQIMVAQTVKIPPAVQETWVGSLGQEDPLEEGQVQYFGASVGMVNHSSIVAWRIPRTEKPGGQQFMRSQRVRHD